MNKHEQKVHSRTYSPVEYTGKLSRHQQEGFANSKYQPHDGIFLNKYQNHLYHRALFGLSVFTQEEIKVMNAAKRKRIIKVHKRTQQVLNTWKQEIVIALSNKFFTDLFPKSDFTRELLSDSLVDPKIKCNLSFKVLKIDKPAVIQKLLCEGVLPKNFHTLNMEPS